MKVGIFGDSFADEYLRTGRSWIECLREDYNYDVVTSFGYGGTSIEWSYNNFLNKGSNFDFIIFLLTDERRMHFTDFANNKELLFHMSTKKTEKEIVQKLRDNSKIKQWNIDEWNFNYNNTDKQILRGTELATIHYMNSSEWKKTAVEESIKYRNKSSIVIDFDSMLRLQKIDYDKFGLTLSVNVKGEGHNRPCHMSLKQNKEFAEYMNDNIQNGISILETLKEPEKHYTVSKTIEEADILC
jgi:hypothetical protein